MIRYSKRFSKSAVTILMLSMSMGLFGCMRPSSGPRTSGDVGNFIVSDISAESPKRESLLAGYSIPTEMSFPFKATIKSKLDQSVIQGAEFEISGGEKTIRVSPSDESGVIRWSEKIKFNYLAKESYIRLVRQVKILGKQTGSREIVLFVNPWQLSKDALESKSGSSSFPEGWVAKSLSALSSNPERKLFIDKLPIETSAAKSGDSSEKNFSLRIEPSILLESIDGNPFQAPLEAAKLEVSAALIEISTSAGVQTKTKIDESKPVATKYVGTIMRADIPLSLRKGSLNSTYMLAIKVAPVDGPKGLVAFEGIFELGDFAHVSTNGTLSAELKAANANGAFAFNETNSNPYRVSPELKAVMNGIGGGGSVANPALTARDGGFVFDKLSATWSGPVANQSPNKRTLMYFVSTCAIDMTNGGRKASGVAFTVNRANSPPKEVTGSTRSGDLGCFTWEDKLEFDYLAPEKIFQLSATIKHASGSETKISYAVAPYERFNFFSDVEAQKEYIAQKSTEVQKPSRFVSDGFEFNLRGVNPEVDRFMGLRTWRRGQIKLPLRVYRPSNLMNGEFQNGEPLRPGKYLIRAAFVVETPDIGVTKKGVPVSSRLVVAPIRNLYRVADADLGFVTFEAEFPIDNVRLVNSRGYMAFDVHILDPSLIPNDDPYLLHPKMPIESYIDRGAKVEEQTFFAGLKINNERDFSIVSKIEDFDSSKPKAGPGQEKMVRVNPLKDMTVPKLYQLAAAQRAEVEKNLNYLAMPSSFLARANADFVSLYNEKQMQAYDPKLGQKNIFLPKTGSADALLKILNDDLKSKTGSNASAIRLRLYEKPDHPQTRETLVRFIRNEIQDDEWLAAHFCLLFADKLLRDHSLGGFSGWVATNGNVLEECNKRISQLPLEQTIYVDRRYRVLEYGGIHAVDAPSFEIMTGAEYAMQQSKTLSYGRGMSASVGLKDIAGPLAPIVSEIPGLGGLALNVHRNRENSQTLATTGAMLTSVNLHVEEQNVEIDVTKYEECAVIRLTPAFWQALGKFGTERVIKSLGKRAGEIMSRGLMMCTGQITSKPMTVTEKYYSFGHAPETGTYNDGYDLRSNPWLITVRGKNDFGLLMTALQGTVPDADKVSAETIKAANYALDRIRQSYQLYGAAAVGSNPGYLPVIINKPSPIR
jgi:hypothetical protein